MCRTALDDVELRGQQINGATSCLLYVSANRDEDAWAQPDVLDVRRDPDPPQPAFGFAEHFCLGASLARREARIVLTELLTRFPNYELTGSSRTYVTVNLRFSGSGYATTPFTLRSMTVSQSRRSISVRISSPCSLKSGDFPGTDGSSSNCTGVATNM